MLIHVNDAVTLQGARALRQPLIIPYGIHQEYELQIVTGHGNRPVDIESRGCVKWTLTITPSPENPTKVLAYAVFAENIATGSYLRFDFAATSVEMYKHVAGNPATPAVLQLQGFTEEDAPATLVITLPVALVTTAQQRLPVDLSTALMQELQLAVSTAGAAQRSISKYASDTTDAAERAELAAINAHASEVNAEHSATAAGISAGNARESETAAETAQGKAETAQSKAEDAQTAAEAAQDAAETAQGKAEDAQSAAETAQSKAEDAQAAAETAQSKAEDAQDAAETAQTAAETAQGKAEDAQTAAEAAQTAAETAQGKAEDAQTAAETAQGKAEDAQTAAETAQGLAEDAKTAAETAQGKAEDAQIAAETAQGKAEDAQQAAETAQTAAETAQGKAEDAQDAAEAAQTAAETAQGKAEDAQTAAETAQGKAEDAQQAAETAQGLAETAQGKAEDAQVAAETAQTAAETAQGKAEDAQDAAEAAQDAAEDAQSAAEGSEDAAAASAKLSESWAKGDTGVRDDEDTNNAKYWAEQSMSFSPITKADKVTGGDTDGMVAGLDAEGNLTNTEVPAENVAQKDGYYAEEGLGAATAENLIDPKATPTNRKFGFDTACGDVSISDDGNAIIDTLRGTTQVVNQLVGQTSVQTFTGVGSATASYAVEGNAAGLTVQAPRTVVRNQVIDLSTVASWTLHSVTVAYDDGVATLTHVAGGWSLHGAIKTITAGHTWAVRCKMRVVTASSVGIGFCTSGYGNITNETPLASVDSTDWTEVTAVVTSANTSRACFYLSLPTSDPEGATAEVKDVELVDLSHYFAASGTSALIQSMTTWDKLVEYDPWFAAVKPYSTGVLVGGVNQSVTVNGTTYTCPVTLYGYGSKTSYGDSFDFATGRHRKWLKCYDLGDQTWINGNSGGKGLWHFAGAGMIHATTVICGKYYTDTTYNAGNMPNMSASVFNTNGIPTLWVRDDSAKSMTPAQFREHVAGVLCTVWQRKPDDETLESAQVPVLAGANSVERAQTDGNVLYKVGISCEVTEWDIQLLYECKYIHRDSDGVYNLINVTTHNKKQHVVGGQDQLISLSHWFGKEQEPSMANFFKLYPTWKDAQIPYIGYEVLNYKGTGVATVGFNCYDHSTGTAVLLGGNKYQICGTYTDVSYTDMWGAAIQLELDADGIFTPPVTGTLTVTGGNDTDTCVHLCWSGYKNYGEPDYKWEPYNRNVKLLPIADWFPDGMNGIKSPYDGVMQRDMLTATEKSEIIGTYTFTGNESWSQYLPGEWSANSHAFSTTAVGGIPVTTAAQGTKTIIPGFVNTGRGTAAAIVRTGYGTGAYGSGKNSGGNNMIMNVQIDELNQGPEVADYMKGRVMYFVRSAPVVTPIAEKLNLIYPVNDFGTEESLPVNTTTLLSTDLDADIKYSLDFTRLGVHFSDMEKPLKDLIEEEPNLARQDGYYAKQGLGAKTAENIVNPNAQPADASFGFRTAAGDVSISDDSTATVAKFLGTTYIRNQLVGESGDSKKTSVDGLINADFANAGDIKSLYAQGDAVVINQQFRSDDMRQSITMNGAIVTSLGGDGVMTLDTEFGGVTEDTEIPLLDVNGARVAEYSGHKYAMWGAPNVSGCYLYMSDPQHAAGADGCVWTSATNGLAVCYLHVPAGTTLYEGVRFRPQIVDVTQLYNGVSSRIADVTSWRKLVKLFPQYKDAMPYNPGEVVFLSATFRVYQDEYAYGFTYDPADGSVQRVQLKDGQVGEVASFAEFDRTPCHQLYRCVMDDLANRHIAYYLDDEDSDKKYDGTRNGVTSDGSASVLTGADGDVMVEFPIGWWSCEEDWNGTGKTLYLMSDRRFRHSRIHPFFYVGPGGNVARKQYIGAYKGAVCDAEGNPLNTVEGALAQVEGDTATCIMRSVKGALPWNNLSFNTARTAAQRHGGQLPNWLYTRWMLLLMITEAGTTNTQTISTGYSYARAYAYYFLRLNGKINFGNGTGELIASQTTTDADAFRQFTYIVDGVNKVVYRTAAADANGYYGWSTNHDPETGIYCWTDTPTPKVDDPIYTDTNGTLSPAVVYYVLKNDELRACKFQYRGVEDPFGCLWEPMDGIQTYKRVVIDAMYKKTDSSVKYLYDRARNGENTYAWSTPDRSETIWTLHRSQNVYAYADAACTQRLDFQLMMEARSLHDCGYWWTVDTAHYADEAQQGQENPAWAHVDVAWPWKNNNSNVAYITRFKADDFMPLAMSIGSDQVYGLHDDFYPDVVTATYAYHVFGNLTTGSRNGMAAMAQYYTFTPAKPELGCRISA